MIYFECELPATGWSACNGATRRKLVIVNKLGVAIEANCGIDCRIAKIDGAHESVLLITPGHDSRTLGVFFLNGYGYTVKEGTEIWTASSVGGYGNSESRVGVYQVGTLIYVHTYKNRRAGTYHRLTNEGWTEVPAYEIEEVEYV